MAAQVSEAAEIVNAMGKAAPSSICVEFFLSPPKAIV